MSRAFWLAGLLLPLSLQAAVDPTLPPLAPLLVERAAGQPSVAPLQLQAILRGPAGSSAVIDGQRLRVGQQQGDLRVIAIRARSVEIERQGQRQVLTLSQPILVPRR